MSYWRNNILFACIIAMLVTLFVSRALLSVSVIAFVIVSFSHSDLRKHIHCFFSSPLLWGMTLLFFLPLISGLWSDNKEKWAEMMQIKLPLLVLPLAFAGPFSFSKKKWEWLAAIFIMVITAGAAWTLFHYLEDIKGINETYLKAKTMVTPLGNDHVRFSWVVSIAALLAGWLWYIKRKQSAMLAWSFFIAMAGLVVFLHILAARTGLFSFYIMLFSLGLWLMIIKKKAVYGAALLVFLLAIPLVAYYSLPSFQNRVKYIQYELGYFKEAHYLPGSNDAVRVISVKAGWNVMMQNPVKGAGFGDIAAAVSTWYESGYPGMHAGDKIYPSNEWLMYGAGCGIPGFLAFCFCVALPFFTKTSNRLLWWLLNVTALFGFLFDIGLEIQFGVFIYSFFILWWYKWFGAK